MALPESVRQPSIGEVDAALDRARAIGIAVDTVRIKSYSGNETEIAEFMAESLRDLDLEVQLQKVAPNRYNAIARWRGRGDGATLMYNGHMDTNPAGEGWTRDPLAGECDGTFIYGIGISNMKAANASFLHAVEMLRKSGFTPRGDLIIAYVVGELQGGVGTVKLLESGVKADYFIVGEPTELTVLTRHAASFVFEIWVYGMTRHLSKREEGIDAIANMETLLRRLRRLRFSGARTAAERALNRIHVGVIHGGMSKEFHDWRPQQLADCCMVKCAGRYGPSQSLDGVMADIQSLLDEMMRKNTALRAELKLVKNNRILMPPFAVDGRAAPVRSVAKAHRAVTGRRPLVGAHTPAKLFGSDAAHLARAGMTGLLYGPGGTYNTMPDERVEIAEITTASRVYARTVIDLTG